MDDPLRRTLLHSCRGGSVNATDYRDYTPLHVAAGMGAAEVVEVLLAAGADPERTQHVQGDAVAQGRGWWRRRGHGHQ